MIREYIISVTNSDLTPSLHKRLVLRGRLVEECQCFLYQNVLGLCHLIVNPNVVCIK